MAVLSLQKRGVERPREKLFDGQRLALAGEIFEYQFCVAAKLPQNLAASAARRGQDGSVGHHRDAPQLAGPFRDRLKDSHALGAQGEAIAGVFHVAASEDAAVFVFNGAAHFEMGMRGVGSFANGFGGGDEMVEVGQIRGYKRS